MATVEETLGVYLEGLERHGTAYTKADGTIHLTLRERIPFIHREDTDLYVCKGGETLLDVAILAYKDYYEFPVDQWQVLQEFQEDPIQDPSVPLPQGLVLAVPSPDFLEEVPYGEDLTEYPQI
jgi:hypothetical protein